MPFLFVLVLVNILIVSQTKYVSQDALLHQCCCVAGNVLFVSLLFLFSFPNVFLFSFVIVFLFVFLIVFCLYLDLDAPVG